MRLKGDTMNGWIQSELKLPPKNLILQEAKLHQCLALWNTQMSVPLSILPGREDEFVAVQQAEHDGEAWIYLCFSRKLADETWWYTESVSTDFAFH